MYDVRFYKGVAVMTLILTKSAHQNLLLWYGHVANVSFVEIAKDNGKQTRTAHNIEHFLKVSEKKEIKKEIANYRPLKKRVPSLLG